MHSFIRSHWKEALSKLSSELTGNSTSKWPELNFTALLSMSAEVLRSPHDFSDSNLLITDCLEQLSDSVTKNCVSLATLKELLKIYSVLVGNLTQLSLPASVTVKRRLSHCLLKLFESNALMPGLVTSVTLLLRDSVNGEDGDMVCANLSRSAARKVVVLLMKYACLLEDQGKQLIVLAKY